LNFDLKQLRKAEQYLIQYRGADSTRLKFESANLYALSDENRAFDEIICYEVLEHIRGDKQIVKEFHRLLRQDGVLHLCCPNCDHPRHKRETLDLDERGGHVRAGYNEESYRTLLEPAGFQIEQIVGIGPWRVYLADSLLRRVRNWCGDIAALPLFFLVFPILWTASFNPQVPFSLYVKARKLADRDERTHLQPDELSQTREPLMCGSSAMMGHCCAVTG
jgi:SAM-dependent methyltransferase